MRPGARNCAIRVRDAAIKTLRGHIGGDEGRQAAYAFVKPQVCAVLDDAYRRIGCPTISVTTVWKVFDAMVVAVRS